MWPTRLTTTPSRFEHKSPPQVGLAPMQPSQLAPQHRVMVETHAPLGAKRSEERSAPHEEAIGDASGMKRDHCNFSPSSLTPRKPPE